MASSFPGAFDNFSDPLANSPLNSPSHATLHSDVNDAVEKIETYMGLVKVIPTGATNGTVGATGTVTIGNAVSSVTVSGAFSSLYDNYLVTIDNHVNSANATFRIALGTSTVGSAYYGTYYADAYTGATAFTRSNNATFLPIGEITTFAENSNEIQIRNPFVAARSQFFGRYYGGTYSGWYSGTNAATTSFTAFTVFPSTGTLTGGTIRVYGYRN